MRRAYLKQALQHHPDKNMHQPQVAHEMFKAVKQAYDILLDEKQRSMYNDFGLDYCLNGPPREPPSEPSQPPPPPSQTAPPQRPPQFPSCICWGCTRTFRLYSAMLQHLETGNCDRSVTLERILRCYRGCGSAGLPVCPGCGSTCSRMSTLLQHLETNKRCKEALAFRSAQGKVWRSLRGLRRSLGLA